MSATTTDTPVDDGFKPELWRYKGRYAARRGATFTLHHEFLTPTDRSALYSKTVSGPIIGAVYEVEVNGNRARVQGAKWVHNDAVADRAAELGIDPPETVPDDEIVEWRLTDRAASATIEAERAKKRLAKNNGDIADLTLAQVKGLIHGSVGAARAGTLAAVLAYLRV